jgi:hypothetical protein
MATKAQIKKIHVLKGILGIEDADYRALLAAFPKDDGSPAASSTELSVHQASIVIDRLENISRTVVDMSEKSFASRAQLKKIVFLWGQVSRATTREGKRKTLQAFLQNKYHVKGMDRLTIKLVPKVIKALRMMQEQKDRKEGITAPQRR